MQVEVSVDEADIGRIRLEDRVTFTVDSFPGQTFAGVVTQIRKAALVVQNVVTYTVVVAVDNPRGHLLPGMTANAKMIVAEKASVLKVPNAALRFRPAGTDGAPAAGARRRCGRAASRPGRRRPAWRRARRRPWRRRPALARADPRAARHEPQAHGGAAEEARSDPAGQPAADAGAAGGSRRPAPAARPADPRGHAAAHPRDPHARAAARYDEASGGGGGAGGRDPQQRLARPRVHRGRRQAQARRSSRWASATARRPRSCAATCRGPGHRRRRRRHPARPAGGQGQGAPRPRL